MSTSPVTKKLKVDDTEATNGEVLSNGNANGENKEHESINNGEQERKPEEVKAAEEKKAPTSVVDRVPESKGNSDMTSTPPAASARPDPNEIIAQLKASLQAEEAKLQFLRKLKLTQAKLKERNEKISQGSTSNQIKEESKSVLPPPPPLIKPECSSADSKTKPFSVIVSNNQAIKPKPDPSSLASSLQALNNIPTNNLASMSRPNTSVQPNRAAMAKILEEMILQQPSPKPKVLQWPICPNINDMEYLHFTGLEFVVDRLKNPKKIEFSNPTLEISCIACGLDFSPEWEKTNSSEKYECYYCFTSKLRKQVREEHTERLKQGFIKVVQKEKEFEKQLQVQQREEQLMQQKLAEQQRQQQQQLIEQQRNLQLQLQQQTLEQIQRQQFANQLLQQIQKTRTGTNSPLATLLQFSQDPTNQLLAQLQKRTQQNSGGINLLQSAKTSAASQDKTASDQAGQLREYLLDLLPRLPSQ